MEELRLDINDDIVDVLKKIRKFSASDINLVIPQGSVIFENILNLKLIKKESESMGKITSFETDDEFGQNMIDSLDGAKNIAAVDDIGFTSHSTPVPTPIAKSKTKSSFKMPSFAFLGGLRNVSNAPKIGLLLGVLVVIGFLIYLVFFAMPTASVSVTVSGQALVKSITIKMSTKATTVSSENKLIPGKVVESSLPFSSSADTTGTKQIGEKATGEITIFNKTGSDKKFSKGTVVSLVSSKDNLKFVLDSEVTVPEETVTDEGLPTESSEPGEKKVKVTAQDFGSKYNISDGKSFKIGDSDTDDYVGENDDDFSGGSSKTVKAVSQEDLDKLSAALFESSKTDILSSLKTKLASGEKLIESTVRYRKVTDTFDKKVGDESDKVSLTQNINATGTYYKSTDLQTLLDSLVEASVPEGFKISQRDSNLEVGVLDTLTGPVVPEEINLEVKIKAQVEPKIDADTIKKDIKGMSIEDAKTYLGKIENVKSYTIDKWPRFTLLLGKLPSSESKITVTIVKEN